MLLPTAVITQRLDGEDSYISSFSLYDALLRLRQTQSPTPRGGVLVDDYFYDSRGWQWKTNTNFWDSGDTPGDSLIKPPADEDSKIADQTVTSFDGLGRPVLAQSLDKSVAVSATAYAYYGDRVTTAQFVPPDCAKHVKQAPCNTYTATAGGTPSSTVTDALGRKTELDSYTTDPTIAVDTSSSAASVTITGGTTQATTYSYNTRGELGTVTDAATGEQWSKRYNLLGQVTSATDPNSGTSTMSYDPNGNVTQLTDANNNPVTYTYDALNRKTGEYDGTSTAAPQLASWVYDNSNNAVAGMPNPIGHLTTETSFYGGHAYKIQQQGFNNFGEPSGEQYTIPGAEGALAGTYLLTHTYDTLVGDPYRDLYPASPGGAALPEESVTHLYGPLDVPDGLDGSELDPCKTGSGTCVDSYDYSVATMNQFSQPMDETLGTGTAYGDVNNSYDPHTGSLTESVLTFQGSGTPIDDTGYTYNPFGQITAQTDTRTTNSGATQAETQCYGYDSLGRLTTAWTATDNCAAQPSSNGGATVGDQIPSGAYWSSWRFDPLGDQTTQTQHSLTSDPNTVTTYSYDGNGAGQPNTLTSSATTGPNPASASYTYDADGNTLTRKLPSGKQSLTWTDDGKLATDTIGGQTSSYIYDADGNLLMQKDPGQTTLYLFGGSQQLYLDTSSGAVTGTRFLPLPGGGTVVRTGTATSYSYELTDQHNTSLLTLDNAVSHPIWRQFTSYGAPRGRAPASWPDPNGFLGAPTDTATGLTILGARQYDPTTGRFISPDPVTDLNSPQQTNGYSYASDNPINSDDPTGLCPSTNCGDVPQPGAKNHRQPATTYNPCGATSACNYWPQPGQLKYMQSLGYTGSPAATPIEVAKWLQQASQSITNPNGAWVYFCQGLAGASTSQCGTNPFNGNTHIYNTDLGQWFSLKGLAAAAQLTGIMSTFELGLADGPEIDGAEALISGGADAAAGDGATSQVIVDTNSVFNRPGVEQALNPGETPVMTQTTSAELRNLVARGSVKMPRFAGDLPVIKDVMDVNARINIRGMIAGIRAGQPGLFGDGAIGATALDTGLPVITADRSFAAVLEQLGVEVRVP